MSNRPHLIELLAVHLPKWDRSRHFAIQSLPESVQFITDPDLIAFRRQTMTWKPVIDETAAVIGKKPAYARVCGIALDFETAIVSREGWKEYRAYIAEHALRMTGMVRDGWFPGVGQRAILRSDMGSTSIITIDRITKRTCYYSNYRGQHFADAARMQVSPLPPFRA